jgi:hypothetical protein
MFSSFRITGYTPAGAVLLQKTTIADEKYPDGLSIYPGQLIASSVTIV